MSTTSNIARIALIEDTLIEDPLYYSPRSQRVQMQQVPSRVGRHVSNCSDLRKKNHTRALIQSYPTIRILWLWPLTIQVTISKIHLKRFENVVKKQANVFRNDLLVEKKTNLSSVLYSKWADKTSDYSSCWLKWCRCMAVWCTLVVCTCGHIYKIPTYRNDMAK